MTDDAILCCSGVGDVGSPPSSERSGTPSKRSLGVDQEKRPAVRNQIPMVAVGRTEQVQNCGEATGVPIESFQLRIIGARSMGDPFHISIAGAGQNGEARKRLPRRRERRKICNQFLERLIETKILGFVGQIMDVAGPRGGPEFEPCDCLAAAMRVAEIGQN